MKKLIFAILTMAICVFLLAGCDDAMSDNKALESTDISSDTEVKSTDNTEIYEEESDVESNIESNIESNVESDVESNIESDVESTQTTEKDCETTEEDSTTTEEDFTTTEEDSTTTEVYENNWEEMKYANGYGYTVSYAGWARDSGREELSQWKSGRYPIFKIDTLEELDQFKSKWGNVFDFSRKYDEIPSFEDTMEKTKWDTEVFYKEHSLLVIYVGSSSGTLRFGVQEIVTTDNSMTIDVVCLNNPEVFTDNMVGWFVFVEITDEEAAKYTSFITD